MAKRVRPNIQVERRGGQLLPVSTLDAEMFEEYPQGQLFDLVAVSNRSDPHHRLYWATLGSVVKATNKWPTADHLHNDLKMLCGYYRTVVNHATGGIYYVPDSTAYKKMDQAEFAQYFDAAMERLSQAIGYDPLEENHG